jgi:hypothetical protein
MQHTSLLTLASTAILLGAAAFTNPVAAQPALPTGSVILSPRVPPAQTNVCEMPVNPPDDDSSRIQTAIASARSTVFFQAGCYYLQHSLRLKSGLTFMGEGSWHWRYGSTLIQLAAPDPATGLGVPIFTIDGTVDSVTIVGLTFDAPSNSLNARGIAAASRGSLLTRSTIAANFFLRELAECIDTPMFGTRIENNEFGSHGDNPNHHRHIHSLYPLANGPPNAGENWIVSNTLHYACCETLGGTGPDSESVLFESPAPLHVIGNDFESGDVDTTLRIHTVPQVFIEGNWFENNHGQAQMTFSPRGSEVHIEENRYVMQEYDYVGHPPGSKRTLNLCNGNPTSHNCLTLDLESASNNFDVNAGLSATHVYMGYEFIGLLPSYGDLVPAGVFAGCGLTIIGPIFSVGYDRQLGGNPICH